jgi:hypothetical protein
LSPARGALGRGELSSDEKADVDCSGDDSTAGEDGTSELLESADRDASEVSESVMSSVEMVELEDSSSECGLDAVIFRGARERAGLLERIEVRLWGCLYGIVIVAESVEAEVSPDESVEAEPGVEAPEVSQLLSMQRRGLEGRPAGVLDAGGS